MQFFILQTFITLHSPFSSRPENDTNSCRDRDEKLQSLPSSHLPICGGSRSSISDLCISPSCKDILWRLLLTLAVFLDWGRHLGPSLCVVDCLGFLNVALELALWGGLQDLGARGWILVRAEWMATEGNVWSAETNGLTCLAPSCFLWKGQGSYPRHTVFHSTLSPA